MLFHLDMLDFIPYHPILTDGIRFIEVWKLWFCFWNNLVVLMSSLPDYFFIRLPLDILPVLELLTRWCASTLCTALLCSTRVGSDLGLVSKWVEGLEKVFNALPQCIDLFIIALIYPFKLKLANIPFLLLNILTFALNFLKGQH